MRTCNKSWTVNLLQVSNLKLIPCLRSHHTKTAVYLLVLGPRTRIMTPPPPPPNIKVLTSEKPLTSSIYFLQLKLFLRFSQIYYFPFSCTCRLGFLPAEAGYFCEVDFLLKTYYHIYLCKHPVPITPPFCLTLQRS